MSQNSRAPSETRALVPLDVGDVMLALGDSIAAGLGAAHVDEGCMGLVAGRLRLLRPALHLSLLAVPGESSTSFRAQGGQLDAAEELIATVQARGQRVAPVLLCLGANDAMEAADVGDAQAVRNLSDNLEDIWSRLQGALAPQGEALDRLAATQTFYNPFSPLDAEPGLPSADQLAPRRARRGGFNEAIRDAAARAGVTVADVGAAFAGEELALTWVRSGDIHPSPAGHRRIADVYLSSCGWETC
ncbi:MAG: SGNH/GDSL hydrolase family protein [Candidatus Dormibacteria bacterium]